MTLDRFRDHTAQTTQISSQDDATSDDGLLQQRENWMKVSRSQKVPRRRFGDVAENFKADSIGVLEGRFERGFG